MRRRQFLTALLAGATVPRMSWADAGDPGWIAAAQERDGGFALFGLDGNAADLFRIPLPARGHAAAAHPTAPEAVFFARRPGRYALVIDCARGHVAARLEAPEGRHFYGHGAFIAGGDLLCTTENAFETGAGRLGLWSRSEGWRRVGEIPTHGIGPHEVVALPGDVLAVANGGIRTDPARDREKLNLDTMRPNLAYLDVERGVLELVELDAALHQSSIRHLAAADGSVAFAMQWQGDTTDPVPLLGLHRRGEAPVLAAAPLVEQLAMQGYAGSVAIAGDHVGITSPRGGRLHVFDRSGGFVASHRRTDACGLAPGPRGFLMTDGLGGVLDVDAALHPRRVAARAWDNHLVALR